MIKTFNHKISDLKYRINGLVPKNVCQKLIKTFEKYSELSGPEESYKYKDKTNIACYDFQKKKWEFTNYNI